MDYPGKVITKTQVTPTQTSASGNWTLDDQAAAIKNNNWPVALVPNPISKSLRFNSADSAYLNRTPATATNRRTYTWSGWFKRCNPATTNTLFSAIVDGNNFFAIRLRQESDNGRLEILNYSAAYDMRIETTQVFRDVSAWYHLVVAIDTTQATSTNRVKLYLNGSQITALSTTTYPSQNFDTDVNNTNAHYVGSEGTGSYHNGYLTEINFIDGQALTPSSFGMTNPQTGQWIPLKYSGTYGTNGFYLNFKDATSTTTLGLDYSGNANNWTTNNFSVTAGSGNDSLTDVPTPWFVYNTTGDVGGVIRGNYCTWNPIAPSTVVNGTVTRSDGNLVSTDGGTTYGLASIGTIAVSSGKWYWEVTLTTASDIYANIGVVNLNSPLGANLHTGICYRQSNGYKDSGSNVFSGGGAGTAYGATYAAGDVIGVALDLDGGTITFYKNGVSQGTAYSSISGNYTPGVGDGANGSSYTFTLNAGQRPFAYTPPTGFRSLCTTNLPATAIGFGLTNQGDDYFNPVLYTGNGTSQTISTGLQPDFIWIKRRDGAAAHTLTDSVRGISKQIFSNLNDAEQTDADSGVTAISSSSITLGDNNLAVGSVNGSGSTYVAWNWNAGGSNATNTSGTITSTVRANTTAGFSIVTYTGNGIDGATVGHGLGVVPSMVIQKRRDGSIGGWRVWHSAIYATSGVTSTLYLNLDYASTADGDVISGVSSTTFTTAGTGATNPSGNGCVAYVFSAVPGYSAFGKYTGNGSADGPFTYTGFRPAFILVKRTDAANYWMILDDVRRTFNPAFNGLYPNNSDAETNFGNSTGIDFLSNGFKQRDNVASTNASGGTYIYAAFAEFPFQFANAR